MAPEHLPLPARQRQPGFRAGTLRRRPRERPPGIRGSFLLGFLLGVAGALSVGSSADLEFGDEGTRVVRAGAFDGVVDAAQLPPAASSWMLVFQSVPAPSAAASIRSGPTRRITSWRAVSMSLDT